MKKKELCAVACLFSLVGCSSPASDEIEIVKDYFPVQFSVQLQKEIHPFPVTRSMPTNTVAEPAVTDKNTGDKELKDFCSSVEYVVYNNENLSEPLKHRTYNLSDPEFSIVYDTLPPGNYQFYFLAHTSENATFTDNVFSFDEISDTFFDTQLLELNKGAETNMDICLQRIVSRIEFKPTDIVPEDIDQFEMAVTHYTDKLDLLTGKGIVSPTERTFSYQFKAEEKGVAGKTHSFYSFTPSGGEKISVTLTSTDMDNQEMRSRTVADITPIENKIIRYIGILYSRPKPDEVDNTFNLIIKNNGEWDEEEDNELPD